MKTIKHAPIKIKAIKNQLNTTNWKNNTIKIIKKYEWIRFKAYCDKLIFKNWKYLKACYTWKERYSIWYGSTSYKWEVIDQKEADRRVNEYLNNNVFPEIENLTCYNDNQKTAIADFMYNSWKYTKHKYTKKHFIYYVKNCDKKTVEWYLAPWLYNSKWLKKRRQAQYNFWKWIQKY